LRKFSLIVALVLPFLTHSAVHAQEFDAAIGAGTMIAPSASSASGNHAPVTLSGGTYPVFSADLLLKRRFGVSGELAWRASRNLYGGFQPERPLFYDINGIYAPKLGKHAAAELMAGVGWASIRFYQALPPAAPSLAPTSSAAIISWVTSGAASVTTFTATSSFAPKRTLPDPK